MGNDRLDDVKGTNATIPKVTPPAMSPPKSQTKSCTNANTMPKPETTKDNSQYSDK